MKEKIIDGEIMDKLFKISFFFIGVSAFLYATKHITAAIMSSNMNNVQANYYEGAYDIVGLGITFWTGISLLTGLGFFITAISKSYLIPMKNRKQLSESESEQ